MLEDDCHDTLGSRALPGDQTLTVIPLTFGRARLGIGPTGSEVFDDVW